MNPKAIKVLIVDDRPISAQGAAALLNRETDIEVVGCVYGGAEALGFLEDNCDVTVVLLDLNLAPGVFAPGSYEVDHSNIKKRELHGEEVAQEIAARHPDVSIIAFSDYSMATPVQRALSAGAVGYVAKKDKAEEIAIAIREVSRTGSYFSPSVREAATAKERPVFTPLQLKHAIMYGQGKPLKETASELGRTLDLVNRTRKRIRQLICPDHPESVTESVVLEYLIKTGVIREQM